MVQIRSSYKPHYRQHSCAAFLANFAIDISQKIITEFNKTLYYFELSHKYRSLLNLGVYSATGVDFMHFVPKTLVTHVYKNMDAKIKFFERCDASICFYTHNSIKIYF